VAEISRLAATAAKEGFFIHAPDGAVVDIEWVWIGAARARAFGAQFRLNENGTCTRTGCPCEIQLNFFTATKAA